MKKRFKLTTDIEIDIQDKITPDFVKKIISEIDKEKNIPNYNPKTKKHQAIIGYIKNNEPILEKCITGALIFNLTFQGFDDELKKRLKPVNFDRIILETAGKMGPEYEAFIKPLFESEPLDNGNKISVEGKPRPISKKAKLNAIKQEIDKEIIQQSLLNFKLTAATLKTRGKEEGEKV